MVSNGAHLVRMVSNGARLVRMVSNGARLVRMVSNGARLVERRDDAPVGQHDETARPRVAVLDVGVRLR